MNNKIIVFVFVFVFVLVFVVFIMFPKMCESIQKSSQDKNVHIEMSLSLLKVLEVKVKYATH